VLTCSNDSTAALFDLETSEVVRSYLHSEGVWCAYPLSEYVFCAAGLMNRLVFWDTRHNRIIQKCELENEETSFVTRLDANSLIFGDRRDLCTCDLRKTQKRLFGNKKMRTSAECILVDEDVVVAAGRGGDVCRFVNSEEDIEPEERNVGGPVISANMMGMFANFQHMVDHLNNGPLDDLDDFDDDL
jgi:WD40 repeat protein